MLIVNCIPYEIAWSPIQHMIRLASSLLDSEVLTVNQPLPSRTRRVLSVLFQRTRRNRRRELCLFICSRPADLLHALTLEGWRTRFGYVAAWIIDSFWTEHIPRVIRLSRPFDHLFVTRLEDLDDWKRATRSQVTWLPWGSDVMALGSATSQRMWDLTRVGRQPPEWENDEDVTTAAESLGLKYHGRPCREGMSPLQNQQFLMSVYRNSKFVLAFSNAANPENYTHPTREYLTGRWVDSLACGAVVAGIPPRGPSVDGLLWSGATLDIGDVRFNQGLAVIAAALKQWTPDIARRNNAMALRNLDWRWRFKVIADAAGANPTKLADELKLLRQHIESAVPDC